MRLLRLSLLAGLIGCVSAFATPIYYVTDLSGANENPANLSAGTGSALVSIDTAAHILTVDVQFSGLSAPVTVAHIHCCVAPPGNVGVATQTPTFVGFPTATAGVYSNTFDTTLAGAFNAAFVTANGGTPSGAEAALASGLANGQAYLNIHTSAFPAGEIRGFLQPVPEPATLALTGVALVGIAFKRRLRKRRG